MARILIDTNVLLRLSDDGSPDQSVAERALSILRLRGDVPCLTPQNIIEFWAVATRPVKANGFDWTTQRTATEVGQLQNKFPILSDSPQILPNWLMLVETHDVKGKNVHDARLVAVMMAHSITRLLTFNTDDFRRFPNITLIHPNEVA